MYTRDVNLVPRKAWFQPCVIFCNLLYIEEEGNNQVVLFDLMVLFDFAVFAETKVTGVEGKS